MTLISQVRRRLGQLGLLLTICGLLFPVYWMVQSSLSTQNQVFHTPVYFFPPHPTLAAFANMLPVIAPYLGNSAIIAVGSVLITLVVSVTMAYGLVLSGTAAHGSVVRLIVLMSLSFPVIMFVIPMYVLFFHLHLLNSYVGVSLADSLYSVPLGVLLMYTYMVTIPSAFFEAAHIDGASSLRTLLSVVLPLSMPAAATTALFAFLGAWGDYLFAATLMNGGNMAPASIGVYTLVATSANISVNWPDVMAASLILGLPTVLAVTLGQRYIRSGLNTGGLVG